MKRGQFDCVFANFGAASLATIANILNACSGSIFFGNIHARHGGYRCSRRRNGTRRPGTSLILHQENVDHAHRLVAIITGRERYLETGNRVELALAMSGLSSKPIKRWYCRHDLYLAGEGDMHAEANKSMMIYGIGRAPPWRTVVASATKRQAMVASSCGRNRPAPAFETAIPPIAATRVAASNIDVHKPVDVAAMGY